MANFVIDGLGLCQGAKLVSTIGRSSIFLFIFRLFPSGEEKIFCAAFCTSLLELTKGMSAELFGLKNRRFDLPVFNMMQNLSKNWTLN